MNAIRAKRKAEGFSVQQLADRVGISKQALSKIETGQSQPKPETLRAICKALGVTKDQLFNYKPPKLELVFTRYSVWVDGVLKERRFKKPLVI
jgi:transcriptional regulator with XRE-family HTH domain